MVEVWADRVEPMIRKFLNEELMIKPPVRVMARVRVRTRAKVVEIGDLPFMQR